MNRLVISSIALITHLGLLSTIHATDTTSQNGSVIHVSDLYNLTQHELCDLMQGRCPDVAIEFPVHTLLPIRFFLTGDVVRLIEHEGSCGQIEVQQTFYLKCIDDQLLLSVDLIEWRPFTEFFQGTVSFTFTLEEGRTAIVAGAEGYRRSQVQR